MNEFSSPYYPPRARWYSPLLQRAGQLRRHLALDRLRLPHGVPLSTALFSLLVPGLGIYLRGPRFWGRLALGLSALLALVFLVELGLPLGNAAFALLLSLHVTSATYAFEPWLAGERFRLRFLFSLGVLLLLGGFLYFPLRNGIQEHWFLSLQVQDRAVIVSRVSPGFRPARGTWLAYSYTGFRGEGLFVQDGLGLAPVLALPGEVVRFTPSAVEVNGVSQPRRAHMPTRGEWVVPQKHWFVWPEVAIGGNAQASPEVIAAALCRLGTITEAQFIGKPCRRWFWRRQL